MSLTSCFSLEQLHRMECAEEPLRNERPKARELADTGRFVVVEDRVAFGKYTDATIGCEFLIQGDFATQGEAEAFIDEISEHFPESGFDLYGPPGWRAPEPEPVPFEAPTYEDDDIPF